MNVRVRGKCTLPGCGLPHSSFGFCAMHAQRLRNHGDPMWKPPTIADRFWAKVDRRGFDECWLWTGALGTDRYGHFNFHGKTTNAHRVSWVLTFGTLPELNVLHKCEGRYLPGDVTARRCVNPEHLKLGTQLENVADCLRTGRAAPSKARGARNGAYTCPEKVRRGECHGRSKVTEEDVRDIRAAYAGGVYQRTLAAMYGLARSTIFAITSRQHWKHVS